MFLEECFELISWVVAIMLVFKECMCVTVSDSLLRQVTALREEVSTLRGTISELDQHRDTLQEQLEKKTHLLSTTHDQLDEKVPTSHILECVLGDLLSS